MPRRQRQVRRHDGADAEAAVCFEALRRGLLPMLADVPGAGTSATSEELAAVIARRIGEVVARRETAVANAVVARTMLWAVLEYER